MLRSKLKKRLALILLFTFWILTSFFLLLSPSLFNDPLSTVIYDRNGTLLGAKIADDGQWRFPPCDSVPHKFREAIILFEDKHFYEHPGVDLLALGRALKQNISAGEIVSGGSTLSMQVIRLAGKNRKRTYPEKIREILLALRLELSYSKDEILNFYASNAPFGGNVVGLNAAAWRYFGRNPHKLSWAEAATLAVLPNAPALIHPGRNQEILLKKRNRLLERLYKKDKMDSITCHLAKLEPLPDKPRPLPWIAPHLLTRIYLGNKGSKTHTTIDANIQEHVNEIVERHQQLLKANQIHNAAVIVAETETGNVIAYVGNTENTGNEDHANSVDIVKSRRSTGSILKPFLFASMLDAGLILQNTLIPDIPTYISGFTPKNYNLTYDGAVPAGKALAKSLNIPAVLMLRNYSVERFHFLLQQLGMNTLNRHPDHYGLTLVLGGAESTLWDLTGMYASLSRVLNHFTRYNSKYDKNDIRPLNYDQNNLPPPRPTYASLQKDGILSAGAIWLTYDALLEVNRPEEELGWKSFGSIRKIAWKTGTSYGYRDAWSVGSTPEYVVGVWVGNADGEGRPGLTGVKAAAPLMFDVFDILPETSWFECPWDDLVRIPVCHHSGHRASPVCEKIDTIWTLRAGLRTQSCPYHRIVHLDLTGNFRVNADCEDISNIRNESWFVLPAVQEWYFKRVNPFYRSLPPLRKDCSNPETESIIAFIYPLNNRKIYIPVELDGTPGAAIFELAHRDPATRVFWHLDDQYLGETRYNHQMALKPEKGKHVVTVVDKNGIEEMVIFEVMSE